MSQLLEARRDLRRKVIANEEVDRYFHLFVTVVLSTNIVLILYALLSITLRMTLGGVWILESLPLALYILPLMVFLPLMLRAYYKSRTAAANFVFLVIASVIFGMLSSLVKGFIICVVLNIITIVIIFIMGGFRLKTGIRKVGRKGLAYFIFLNVLGLMFPVSVVVMGQSTIASTTPNVIPEVSLTIPLSDFDFPYQHVTPDPGLLAEILDNAIILDFKILESNSSSWLNLRTWLEAINNTENEYTITLVADRGSFVVDSNTTLATSELIETIYQSHKTAFANLIEVSLKNITNTPNMVLFDMTLSRQEWQSLMIQIRSLSLVGFGGLLRTSIDSTDLFRIHEAESSLRNQTVASGLNAGLIVETFVIDDLQDGDTGAMRLCGVTVDSFRLWDQFIVSCERSRFSFEMNGDVGEYLTHTYASSISGFGSHWGLRLGEVGNSTDVIGRQDSVYETMDVLCNDIALALGHGVRKLTIGSLQSLLSTFGHDTIDELRSSIDATQNGVATYTFRIYAFRAVFTAIDVFDIIML